MKSTEDLRNILGPVDKYRGGRYEEIRDALARLYEHFATVWIVPPLPPEAHRSKLDPGALIGSLQDDIKALADDSELNKKIAELTAIIENQKKGYRSLYEEASVYQADLTSIRDAHRQLMTGIKLLLGYTHWPSFIDEVGTSSVVDGVLLLLRRHMNSDLEPDLKTKLRSLADRWEDHAFGSDVNACGKQLNALLSPSPCKHERLTPEGMCRACGADCRGIS